MLIKVFEKQSILEKTLKSVNYLSRYLYPTFPLIVFYFCIFKLVHVQTRDTTILLQQFCPSVRLSISAVVSKWLHLPICRRQLLTDFQFCFTSTFYGKFVTKWLLKFGNDTDKSLRLTLLGHLYIKTIRSFIYRTTSTVLLHSEHCERSFINK